MAEERRFKGWVLFVLLITVLAFASEYPEATDVKSEAAEEKAEYLEIPGVSAGPYVDVLMGYGGGVNRTKATISSALTGVGTTNKVAFFMSQGTWTIDDDLTITSNITLVCPPGCILSVSSGKTLTINGGLEAGLDQIFSGSGTIDLSGATILEKYPEWWGAVGDNSTDCTAAIQSAINAGWQPVRFAAGVYILSDQITFPQFNPPFRTSPMLVGAGEQTLANVIGSNKIGTVLKVISDPFDKALFYLKYTRSVHVKDMTIYGPGKAVTGSIAFDFKVGNSRAEMENVNIYGWETCLKFSGGNMDDSSTFRNVAMQKTKNCVHIRNSQSFNLNFHGCTFEGEYGLYNVSVGNSIQVFGSIFFVTNTAFYNIDYSGQTFVSGCHFESTISESETWALVYNNGGGNHRQPAPITIIGCTLGGGGGVWWNPTRAFIHFWGPGPFLFANNTIGMESPIVKIENMTDPNVSISSNILFMNNFWYYEPEYRKVNNTDFPTTLTRINEHHWFRNRKAANNNDYVPMWNTGVEYAIGNVIETTGNYQISTGLWGRGSKVYSRSVNSGGAPGKFCISRVDTTLSADAVTTAANLTIASSADMAVGDYIGCDQDNGVVHWTTIATIPDATHVTLTNGLTNDMASGRKIYTHRWADMANIDLSGSVTWDPGSLGDGADETISLTVTGAALGDYVLVSAPYDLQDCIATAYVQAADTVKVRLQNESGRIVDLASGTWKAKVIGQ